MKRQIHTIDLTEHSVGEEEEEEEEEEEQKRWYRVTGTFDAFPLRALQVAFGNGVAQNKPIHGFNCSSSWPFR